MISTIISTSRAFMLRAPSNLSQLGVHVVRSHRVIAIRPATTIPTSPSPPTPDTSSNNSEKLPWSRDTAPYQSVEAIKGEEHLMRMLGDTPLEGVLVVKFHALFCRACKAIERKYQQTATKYSDRVKFAEVEFDSNKSLCQKLGIRSLPHVQVFAADAGKIADFSIAPLKYDTLTSLLDEHRAALSPTVEA